MYLSLAITNHGNPESIKIIAHALHLLVANANVAVAAELACGSVSLLSTPVLPDYLI